MLQIENFDIFEILISKNVFQKSKFQNVDFQKFNFQKVIFQKCFQNLPNFEVS